MKSDHTKFSGSQQYEMNTKFGSYLQSTTCISLFYILNNIESSESWFAPYLSLFELLSQKSWSRRLKKTSQRTFQSSELRISLSIQQVRLTSSAALYLKRSNQITNVSIVWNTLTRVRHD